jgi:hypothetical protein
LARHPKTSNKPDIKVYPAKSPLKQGLVSDILEIRRLLQIAADERSRAIVWNEGKEVLIRTKTQENENPKEKITLLIPNPKPETIFKNDQLYKITIIYKHLPLISLNALYLTDDNTRYFFQVPKELVRIQRRKDERVQIPAGYDIRVVLPHAEHREKLTDFPLFDLSPSGLSFLISIKDQDKHPVGSIISLASFTLRSKRIAFKGQIQNSSPHSSTDRNLNGPTLKIGISFTFLLHEDLEHIENFVLENLVQYF